MRPQRFPTDHASIILKGYLSPPIDRAMPIAIALLAQAAEITERGYAYSWAIILFSVILGLVVALRPTKREDKVKLPRQD